MPPQLVTVKMLLSGVRTDFYAMAVDIPVSTAPM